MVTQQELAQKLYIARRASGMSQEEVADLIGVSRPTISQIEAGKRGISSLEMAKLAKLYGRSLASFFEDVEQEDPLIMLFRATSLRPEDQQVIKDFEQLCRTYADLENLLELNNEVLLPDYSEIGEPRNKMEAIHQGEQVASSERHRLGIGDDPIRDVFELFDTQGVRLFVRPLQDTSISGIFLYNRNIGPCMLINGAEHHNRLAFNAAHEYAHVLLDRKLQAHASTASRFLGDTDSHGELLEIRANSFAAAFLLPKDGILQFLLNRGKIYQHRDALDVVDILSLQRAFGVSYQAALYRLQNLNWLSRSKREEMAHHSPHRLAQALGLLNEDEIVQEDRPVQNYSPRYIYLVLEAYRREKISLGKLAELLSIDILEARELVWDLEMNAETRSID
jgi:Zn-dependent peptidase ImmA (M78 family)/DNA-binding XRE family transcriptional regulator